MRTKASKKAIYASVTIMSWVRLTDSDGLSRDIELVGFEGTPNGVYRRCDPEYLEYIRVDS